MISFLDGIEDNVYHNVLFFPKILNELQNRDDVIEDLCDSLSSLNFNHDEYYICISHSRDDVIRHNGASVTDKIINAINGAGEFEVCDDIEVMLGDEWDSFKAKWLVIHENNENHDHSFDICKPGNRNCYGFARTSEKDFPHIGVMTSEGEFGIEQSVENYFGYSNSECSKLVPRLKNKRAEIIRNGYEGNLTQNFSPVTRVSQIMFQVIRLKKRA